MAKRKAKQRPTISQALREHIRDSGVSLRGLALCTSVDNAILSRFMRGERAVTLATVDRLADALGLVLVEAPPPSESAEPPQ